MQLYQLDLIRSKELAQGFQARFVHAENMTFAYWQITEAAVLPSHSHPHEQVVNMLMGKFELTVDKDTRVLVPGDVVIIPPHAEHSGKALSHCSILDVFHPVREDYRSSCCQ